MSTQDKIKGAISLVEEGLQSITSEREWLNFLKFQSLFYQYSYSNTILIYLQNPEATFVKLQFTGIEISFVKMPKLKNLFCG